MHAAALYVTISHRVTQYFVNVKLGAVDQGCDSFPTFFLLACSIRPLAIASNKFFVQ